MTTWWKAHRETAGHIHFAGEACDEDFWSYKISAVFSGERVVTEIYQR